MSAVRMPSARIGMPPAFEHLHRHRGAGTGKAGDDHDRLPVAESPDELVEKCHGGRTTVCRSLDCRSTVCLIMQKRNKSATQVNRRSSWQGCARPCWDSIAAPAGTSIDECKRALYPALGIHLHPISPGQGPPPDRLRSSHSRLRMLVRRVTWRARRARRDTRRDDLEGTHAAGGAARSHISSSPACATPEPDAIIARRMRGRARRTACHLFLTIQRRSTRACSRP